MKATRDALGYQLPLMGELYKNIVALDADLSKATKLDSFFKKFPERSFQIGIAEANMIGIASGMSEYGFKVFIASFASFLTGRYDIIRCSIGYSKAPVVLVGTHGGLAIGKDGVTQMGLEDISLMRSMPNMKVINPATYTEALEAIKYLCETDLKDPYYLRLGRQPIEDSTEDYYKSNSFEFGKGVTIKDGTDITLVSTGCILPDVLKACELLEKNNISTRVINIHTIKPIDKEILIKASKETKRMFTIEDHSIIGGLGSAVCEVLSEFNPTKVTRIGLNDIFPESGDPIELYDKYGLSSRKILEKVLDDIS